MKNLIWIIALILVNQVHAQELSEVITENFDNNSLNWDLSKCTIADGKLKIVNSSKDALLVMNSANYDHTKEFAIEAQLTLNNPNSSFLFMTNYKDDKSDNLGFLVDANTAKAYYWVGSREVYSQGNVYAYKKVTEGLSQKGAKITFRAEYVYDKYGQNKEMTYYINGTKMGSDIHVKKEKMNQFGFMAFNGTDIEVDYIKVSGTKTVEEVKEAVTPNVMQVATTPLGGSPTTSLKTIKAGDPIYAKVFLKKSFLDLMKGTSYKVKITERVYINNEAASEYSWTMDGNAIKSQGNGYAIEMAPPKSSTKYPQESFSLSKKLVDLKAGVHDVKLVVIYQKVGLSMSNTLGEVSFKFDNTSESGRTKLVGMVGSYRATALKNVKLPEAKMTNTELETSVKELIAKSWPQKPLKVIILEKDWGTINDKYYGNILQRTIKVAVVTKNSNGFCQIFYPSIFQKYLGGNKYSKEVTLGGTHSLEEDIDCGNVK